jgi:hypothetical protein
LRAVLRGRLTDGGLFDALQIANRRREPSRLVVHSRDATFQLRFAHGRLVDACELGRPMEGRVAVRLRRLDVVDESTFRRALVGSAQTGRSLLDVLQREHGVSPGWIERARAWERTDAWLSAATSSDGTYSLRGDERPQPPPDCDAPTVDAVILAGIELNRVWRGVLRWVPSWDLVIEHRRHVAASPCDVPNVVTALEAELWTRARPGQRAGALADAAGGPRTHARWALARLVARGALTWAPMSGSTPKRSRLARGSTRIRCPDGRAP